MIVRKLGKILLLAALAACLSVSVCNADDFKIENLDEAAFDGQWVLPFNYYIAYIPAEIPYVDSSGSLAKWELDGSGDEKRARFTVQDYSTIIELGMRGVDIEKDRFVGIEEGDEPYYTLAFAALMDDAADEVSKDDFVSINGLTALVYPNEDIIQSSVTAYVFDGQKVVSFYLFLRNYEEPEVIIENVLCSLSTPDSFSGSDSAETTDDSGRTGPCGQDHQKL